MGEWDNLDWGAFDPYASEPTLGWTGSDLWNTSSNPTFEWTGGSGGFDPGLSYDPGEMWNNMPGESMPDTDYQTWGTDQWTKYAGTIANPTATTGGSGGSSIFDAAVKGLLGIGGSLLNNLLAKPQAMQPSRSGVTVDQKARNSVYSAAMPYQEALLTLLGDAGMTPAESQEWQNALMTMHETLPYQQSAAAGILDTIQGGAKLSKYTTDAADLAYKYSAPNEQELEEIKRDMRLYYGHGADEAITMDKINKYILDSRRQAAEILAQVGKQAEDLGVKNAALIPGGIQAYQSLVGPEAMAKQISLAGADKTKTMEDVKALQALITLAQMYSGMSTMPYSVGATVAGDQNPQWSSIVPTLLNVLYPQTGNTQTTGQAPATTTNSLGSALNSALYDSIFKGLFS